MTDDHSWPIDSEDDGPPMAFIQWKGTDVCMNVRCLECSELLHVCGETFAYYVECSTCGHVMQMKAHVEYRSLPEGVKPNCDPVTGVGDAPAPAEVFGFPVVVSDDVPPSKLILGPGVRLDGPTEGGTDGEFFILDFDPPDPGLN